MMSTQCAMWCPFAGYTVNWRHSIAETFVGNVMLQVSWPLPGVSPLCILRRSSSWTWHSPQDLWRSDYLTHSWGRNWYAVRMCLHGGGPCPAYLLRGLYSSRVRTSLVVALARKLCFRRGQAWQAYRMRLTWWWKGCNSWKGLCY